MGFDVLVFATALYALITETIEDSFVLIIYQAAFGKKNIVYGLVFASVIVSIILIVLVLYGIPQIGLYSEYVVKASGLFLIGLGGYWIVRFLLTRAGIVKAESEESELKQKPVTKSFVPFVMVFVELLEILAILVPFVLTSHIFETSLSLAVSIAISILLMFIVGGRLRSKFENKLTLAKFFAGVALTLSGFIIIINLR
jgi:hypothetical protein